MTDAKDLETPRRRPGAALTALTAQDRRRIAAQRLAELEAKLAPAHRAYYASVPPRYRRAFLNAYVGTGATNAIKVKCLDCVGFSSEAVAECEIRDCALWPVRPYQQAKP